MTPEDNETLKLLNHNVEAAIIDRRLWLDSKMGEYAKFKVGDSIYDIDKGVCLGVVTSLYRYFNGRDDIRDNSLVIEYYFKKSNGVIDNTSSNPYKRYGTKEELIRHGELKLDVLRT